MPIRKYTLHDFRVQGLERDGLAIEAEVTKLKEAAIADFKTKVVWNKRTQSLVNLLGLQAYVLNPESKTFEIDIEYAKEMAQLNSLQFDGGSIFLGW